MEKMEMYRIREALEASWRQDTAYEHVYEKGNPALGQCYPTSRVVQHYFPETKIARGFIWTGKSEEMHFWNILDIGGTIYHIDFSWRQFPPGSSVVRWALLSEDDPDSEATVKRIETLLKRVQDYIKNKTWFRKLPPGLVFSCSEIVREPAASEHSEYGRRFGIANPRAATSYGMASMGERKSAADPVPGGQSFKAAPVSAHAAWILLYFILMTIKDVSTNTIKQLIVIFYVSALLVQLLVVAKVVPYNWVNGGMSKSYEVQLVQSLMSLVIISVLFIFVLGLASQNGKVKQWKLRALYTITFFWLLGLFLQIAGTEFERYVLSLSLLLGVISHGMLAWRTRLSMSPWPMCWVKGQMKPTDTKHPSQVKTSARVHRHKHSLEPLRSVTQTRFSRVPSEVFARSLGVV